MRVTGWAVAGCVLASLLSGAPGATASTEQPLATVEVDGFTVSTAGYWPSFGETYTCNSYLFTYTGTVPSQTYVIRLDDAVTGNALGFGGTRGDAANGTGTITACGAGGVESLRLTLGIIGGEFASSPTFTWGGTPPVVTDLPEGTGSVRPGDATIATSGPWLAPPRPDSCTGLSLTGEFLPDVTGDPFIRVVDAESRTVIGTGNLAIGTSGDGSTAGIIQVCRQGGIPTPAAIVLQAATDVAFAEGEPFTWSASAPDPPPASNLPFTGQAGSVSIESAGLWPKPDFASSPDADSLGGSYLIRYRGMPTGVTSYATVVDSRTREVIGVGGVVGRAVPTEGVMAINTADGRPAGASFYIALEVLTDGDGSGFVELGPFAWDPRATSPPPSVDPPGSVRLGPVKVTTIGDWTAPKKGDVRRVRVSGLNPEASYALVSLVDTVTRRLIATEFVEPESARSVALTVTTGMRANSRFALQVFMQEWGINEGRSTRWAAPATAPGAVRGLAVTPAKGKGAVVVTWQAPAKDGGAKVTSYQYRAGNGSWKSTTSSRVTLSGLRSKKPVTVSVRAVNSVGPGPVAKAKGTPR
jgi:hypothetical protein